jgi:hypothetical protein
MVITFTAWFWGLVYMFGFLTSPLVALPLMLGMLAALWFDAQIGLVALVGGQQRSMWRESSVKAVLRAV